MNPHSAAAAIQQVRTVWVDHGPEHAEALVSSFEREDLEYLVMVLSAPSAR